MSATPVKINRRAAGLVLLMWACLPIGVVAWILTGNWRWAAAGFVVHVTGWCLAWLIRAGVKRP